MLKEIASTPVSYINIREPVRVKADTALGDVVNSMREMRRGAAIVEDDAGTLIGIFTERDLMLRVDHGDQGWRARPVSEMMTAEVISVQAQEPLSEAVLKMQSGFFRHLPVVFPDERPVGMVSIRDILAYIAEHFPAEFLNLPPDPEHEARNPWGG